MASTKDLQRSLYISSTSARIESILKTLMGSQELEGEEMRWAIELASGPRDRTATSDAWLHDEYVAPVLSRQGDLTIFGGSEAERAHFATYLRAIRSRLFSKTL